MMKGEGAKRGQTLFPLWPRFPALPHAFFLVSYFYLFILCHLLELQGNDTYFDPSHLSIRMCTCLEEQGVQKRVEERDSFLNSLSKLLPPLLHHLLLLRLFWLHILPILREMIHK